MWRQPARHLRDFVNGKLFPYFVTFDEKQHSSLQLPARLEDGEEQAASEDEVSTDHGVSPTNQPCEAGFRLVS